MLYCSLWLVAPLFTAGVRCYNVVRASWTCQPSSQCWAWEGKKQKRTTIHTPTCESDNVCNKSAVVYWSNANSSCSIITTSRLPSSTKRRHLTEASH